MDAAMASADDIRKAIFHVIANFEDIQGCKLPGEDATTLANDIYVALERKGYLVTKPIISN
jgi:hypothetical protein